MHTDTLEILSSYPRLWPILITKSATNDVILFFERKNYEMSCVRVRECVVTADLVHRIPGRDTLRTPHWCTLTREPQLQFEVKPSAYLTVTVVQSPPQGPERLSCTWNPASSCLHDHHAVKYGHSPSFTDLFFLRHDGFSPSLNNSRCLTFLRYQCRRFKHLYLFLCAWWRGQMLHVTFPSPAVLSCLGHCLEGCFTQTHGFFSCELAEGSSTRQSLAHLPLTPLWWFLVVGRVFLGENILL